MPVSAEEFRNAMRRWASGVSVVTTHGESGVEGITVASFCSLSLNPPLVLVCINRSMPSHERIATQGAFGVNVLTADQREVSDRAGGRADDPSTGLEGIATRTAVTGAPLLVDCLAWLDCTLVEQHEGGDHTLFVGRVEAAGAVEGQPLLWFSSGYHGLGRTSS